jgi:soluble lytic murein transglycosylase-like protein
MAALIRTLLSVSLAAATPGVAGPVDRWQTEIEEGATRSGIPASWIAQVIRAESGGRTTLDGRPIRSSKGAIGLMQLMPATWSAMRTRFALGEDPDDPRDNILAGSFYLRRLYDRFGYPGLFAAYHAGPERYRRYLAGEVRLPAATRIYLVRLAGLPIPPASSPAPDRRESTAAPIFALGAESARARQDPAPSWRVMIVTTVVLER